VSNQPFEVPDTEITVEEYWALPEPALSETEVLQDGGWMRLNRFISDGSDITVEKSAPKP
jgi:hypothetical protein